MSNNREIDTPEVIISCLVLGFSTVIGAIINLVIIAAIIGSKKLRRPADGLIVAAIVNELILCLFLYPIHMYELLTGQQDHLDMLCIVDAIALPFSFYQTITILPVIAYNRYVFVTKPRHIYNDIFSLPKVVTFVMISIILPFVCIGIPIILVTRAWIKYSVVYRMCIVTTNNGLYAYLELVYFIISYMLTVFPYARLFIYVRTHVTNLNVRQQAVSSVVTSRTRVKTKAKMDERALRMVGIVSVGYSICFLPHLLLRTLDHNLTGIPALFHKISLSILSLGVFINPMLFVITNSWHLLAIKGILKCKSPDTYITTHRSFTT